MFGLSFLAGIIDSMQKYLKYRRKKLAKDSFKRLSNFKEKLSRQKDVFYTVAGGVPWFSYSCDANSISRSRGPVDPANFVRLQKFMCLLF